MPALRHPLVSISLPKLFLQRNPTPTCSSSLVANSSSWYPSSEECRRASSQKMHWRRYGYINQHSAADHDGSTDSRHWRGQVGCHYESSLWTGHAEIRVTVRPIRSTPTLVWVLFPSGRRQQY